MKLEESALKVYYKSFIQLIGDNTLLFLSFGDSCDKFAYKISKRDYRECNKQDKLDEDTWETIKTKNEVSFDQYGDFLVTPQGRFIYSSDFQLNELDLGNNIM